MLDKVSLSDHRYYEFKLTNTGEKIVIQSGIQGERMARSSLNSLCDRSFIGNYKSNNFYSALSYYPRQPR